MITDHGDMGQLADLLEQMSGVPRERTAGFVAVLAVWEEDGTPGGRIFTSLTTLRKTAALIDVAREHIQEELERLAGQS
jgi:hypothetical protein